MPSRLSHLLHCNNHIETGVPCCSACPLVYPICCTATAILRRGCLVAVHVQFIKDGTVSNASAYAFRYHSRAPDSAFSSLIAVLPPTLRLALWHIFGHCRCLRVSPLYLTLRALSFCHVPRTHSNTLWRRVSQHVLDTNLLRLLHVPLAASECVGLAAGRLTRRISTSVQPLCAKVLCTVLPARERVVGWCPVSLSLLCGVRA